MVCVCRHHTAGEGTAGTAAAAASDAHALTHRRRSPQNKQTNKQAFEGLLPEEDYEVPGTYFDALAGGTKLGKAVRAACDELNHLGGMVRALW